MPRRLSGTVFAMALPLVLAIGSVREEGRIIVPGFDGVEPELAEARTAAGAPPDVVRAALAAPHPDLPEPGPLPGEHGLFDLPAPALAAVDRLLAGLLPASLRIPLWSAFGAFLSMLIYRLVSPQKRLAALREETVALRRRLAGFEGDFSEMAPLLRRNLALSFRQLGLTFGPAMLAGLPAIFVLAFLSNAFDARLPQPGERIVVGFEPEEGPRLPAVRFTGGEARELAPGRFEIVWPGAGERVELRDSPGTLLAVLPPPAPVRTLHPRRWWNVLIGNPAGYLPASTGIASVTLELPRPRVLPAGPDWLAGWPLPALVVMAAVSLALKFAWRLT